MAQLGAGKPNLARERGLDRALGDFSSILWFPPRQRAALVMVPRQMKRSQPWNTLLGCSCISFESCQAEFLAVCSGGRRQGAPEGKPAPRTGRVSFVAGWCRSCWPLLPAGFALFGFLGDGSSREWNESEPCRAARDPRCAAWVCGKGTARCRWHCQHQLEMLLGAKTH